MSPCYRRLRPHRLNLSTAYAAGGGTCGLRSVPLAAMLSVTSATWTMSAQAVSMIRVRSTREGLGQMVIGGGGTLVGGAGCSCDFFWVYQLRIVDTVWFSGWPSAAVQSHQVACTAPPAAVGGWTAAVGCTKPAAQRPQQLACTAPPAAAAVGVHSAPSGSQQLYRARGSTWRWDPKELVMSSVTGDLLAVKMESRRQWR